MTRYLVYMGITSKSAWKIKGDFDTQAEAESFARLIVDTAPYKRGAKVVKQIVETVFEYDR